jgi:hypothetical protein
MMGIDARTDGIALPGDRPCGLGDVVCSARRSRDVTQRARTAD